MLFWLLESVASGIYSKVPLLLVLLMLPFSHELGRTGLGIVVCDSRGSFLFGQSSWLDGCLSVQEGEAVGVREALSWVKQLGFQNVIVETYAKYVAMSLSSKK